MRVRILGPLRIEDDGRAIPIAALKERALLARLALDAGRPVSAGAVIEALWGDSPPASATKTAQSLVARLRRALPTGWISSDGGTYTLTLSPDDVDSSCFERAIVSAGSAIARHDHRAVVELLAGAVALCAGRPVPELEDSAIGSAAIARLEDLRRTAEEDLADARLALGGGSELVADLMVAARAEPLRERRWAQLMTALYRAGRQADALRAYQEARTALVEGLGIEPGDALQATEKAVLTRDGSLLAAPGAVDEPTLPGAIEAITASELAGRALELAELDARWQEVRALGTRAVVITGEPGIGKTRLAGEGARRTHGDGALVLFGRCDPDGLVPYQAIVDALREVGLDQHVPELRDDLAAARPLADADRGGRARLFGAITDFLDARAAGRPVVLLVDDLQWADRETVVLLRHLVRSTTSPLLLLGTHRTEAASDPDVSRLLAELPPESLASAIELSGLDQDTVGHLIGATDDTVVAVHRSTGGSPLFIGEMIRFRDAHGRFPEGEEVPLGVRHAVASRIAQLPGHARRLLDAAAIAGENVAIAEVAQVAGLAESEAIDIVDRAIATKVLTDHGNDSIVFAHDLVRGALLQDMSAPRRAYLHRRVAETIVATTGKPARRASVIAHHLAAASAGPDAAVARWAIVAADHFLGRYAWDAAATQLVLALEHAGGAGGDRIELLLRLAETYRTAGMETPARERFAEAAELARLHPDPTVYRAVVVRWTHVPVDVRTELGTVIDLLRDALARTPDDGSAHQAELMGRLSFSLAWAGDPHARALADDAIAVARRAGDPRTLARTLVFSRPSRDQFEAHDPDDVAELLALVPNLDDPELICQIHHGAIVGHLQRGDRGAAEVELAELHRRAELHQLPGPTFYANRLDGYLALDDGDLAAAERTALDILAAAARIDLPNLVLVGSTLLYDIRRVQGRLAELLPWFERRQDAGERIPRAAAMRVEVLAAAGRLDAARTAIDELRVDHYGAITPSERPHSVATLADAAITIGAADACAELASILRPWSGLVVFDSSNGPLEPVDSYLERLAAVVPNGA